MSKTFTIIYILTLVIARTIAYIYSKLDIDTFTDSWHHLYTGVVILMLLYFFQYLRNKKFSVILLAIALALIVDELILAPVTILYNPDPIQNYFVWYSWLGLVIFSLIVLKCQKTLINKFVIL